MYKLTAIIFVFSIHSLLVSAKPPDWVTDEMMAMVNNDKGRCMSEHGTTEAQIDEVNAGNIPNDKSITCYMYCLLEAFSIFDDEGELETEILIGILPENLQTAGRDLIEACAKQSESDLCDKTYAIAKCIQSKRPDLWFMV